MARLLDVTFLPPFVGYSARLTLPMEEGLGVFGLPHNRCFSERKREHRLRAQAKFPAVKPSRSREKPAVGERGPTMMPCDAT